LYDFAKTEEHLKVWSIFDNKFIEQKMITTSRSAFKAGLLAKAVETSQRHLMG